MLQQQRKYYENRAKVLLKNLRSRSFEAYYCENSGEALKKALELIPKGVTVGLCGTVSAEQIGLLEAVKGNDYQVIDREEAKTAEERGELARQALLAHTFITGSNAISLDGQLVNIDRTGNRVASIAYGPESIIVIAGMNKVADTLEAAISRARSVAAPVHAQHFPVKTPCKETGICADCKSEDCICNQLLITRRSKPAGRIKVILVGEPLGF